MQVKDKAAVITGGGTGVGRATAMQLAQLGCSVLVNYSRSAKEAEQTVADIQQAGGRAIACRADVANDDDCRAMIDTALSEFGRLDMLINNAGTTEFIAFSKLDAVSDEVWQKLLAVNVIGPFHCTRAAADAMRDTAGPDGAEIVNVSSVAGIIATGSCIPYAACKAALNNMTVALARTLAPQIRVNAVAPGFITGRWLDNGLGERYESTKQAFDERMPLGRVCDPPDVAAAILSLITGSDLVTGQVLTCDSGMCMREPVRI